MMAIFMNERRRTKGDVTRVSAVASRLLAIQSSHVISMAYGNYPELGRVLQLVADESGLPAEELTCVSASATAEINRADSFPPKPVEALLDDCKAALRTSP
jgi:hypothetical protein